MKILEVYIYILFFVNRFGLRLWKCSMPAIGGKSDNKSTEKKKPFVGFSIVASTETIKRISSGSLGGL